MIITELDVVEDVMFLCLIVFVWVIFLLEELHVRVHFPEVTGNKR